MVGSWKSDVFSAGARSDWQPILAGLLKEIEIEPSLNMIVDKLMWWKQGDQVTDVLTTKFGIVFLKFKSQDEMMDITDKLHELIYCQIY